MKKAALALFTAALFLCTLAFRVSAAAPDVSRAGSISITMTYRGQAVPGGSLTLYRVGELQLKGQRYDFLPTGDFAASGIMLENINDSALALSLSEFAKSGNLAGIKQDIDAEGRIAFRDLALGLYLLVQEDAAEGYAKVAPFLVSIPIVENGAYLYDVDGSPKLSLEQLPTEPPAPPPSLPQTGQTQGPIPVLTVSGLLLITLGAYLCSSGRKKHED